MNITVTTIHQVDDMRHERTIRFEAAEAGYYEARFANGDGTRSIMVCIEPGSCEALLADPDPVSSETTEGPLPEGWQP